MKASQVKIGDRIAWGPPPTVAEIIVYDDGHRELRWEEPWPGPEGSLGISILDDEEIPVLN